MSYQEESGAPCSLYYRNVRLSNRLLDVFPRSGLTIRPLREKTRSTRSVVWWPSGQGAGLPINRLRVRILTATLPGATLACCLHMCLRRQTA